MKLINVNIDYAHRFIYIKNRFKMQWNTIQWCRFWIFIRLSMDVDYSFVALSLKKYSNSIGFLAIRGRSTIMLSEFFLLFLLQLFYLQLTFQRRKLRQTFIHSWNRVFTTNTVEGALTTVRSIRSFAVQALTFNCVKWEQEYCYKSSCKDQLLCSHCYKMDIYEPELTQMPLLPRTFAFKGFCDHYESR